MNKRFIVITTIYQPTEAIKEFAKFNDYNIIVIGDTKTPDPWHCENVEYYSVEDNRSKKLNLFNLLPINHYSRKMLGYLAAIESDAAVIIDTDDDNIPTKSWSFPSFNNHYNRIDDHLGFVNIYNYFTNQKIWPRGLPLKYINTEFNFDTTIKTKDSNVGIWQGLADIDPDVDAIYRLTDNRPCTFENKAPVVLGNGTVSPFNTQNTCICKELFPLLYLPTYVNFRFTDILRGLVAQPIMWLYGYYLGFTGATVVQKRNPHDYFQDFLSEIPMYENAEKVIEIAMASLKTELPIAHNLFNVYLGLLGKGIVKKEEIVTLEAWLNDLDCMKK